MNTAEAIQRKIGRLPRGKPFTLNAVQECGPSTAVRQSLSRLVRKGELLRPAQGVYARPKPNRWFGHGLPDPSEVVRAIAHRNGERLEEHGAEAARRFGLSAQMPAGTAFYTTGRTRSLKVGETTVRLEAVPPKFMRYAGTGAGKAVAALLYMGREHVTPEMVAKVYARLDSRDRKRFEEQARTLPAWLRDAFRAAIRSDPTRA